MLNMFCKVKTKKKLPNLKQFETKVFNGKVREGKDKIEHSMSQNGQVKRESYKLKNWRQKIEEEKTLIKRFLQLYCKLTNQDEEWILLKTEDGTTFNNTGIQNERATKEDEKSLVEQDLEIEESPEELQQALEEMIKDKNYKKQAEDRPWELGQEELQKSTEAIIAEKDARIEQLERDFKGFRREVNHCLNQISELNKINIQIKEEDGNENPNQSEDAQSQIAKIHQQLEESVLKIEEIEEKVSGRAMKIVEDDMMIENSEDIDHQSESKSKKPTEDGYVSVKYYNEAITQMQAIIDEKDSEIKNYSAILDTIKGNISTAPRRSQTKKSVQSLDISKVLEPHSLIGKRNFNSLLSNCEAEEEEILRKTTQRANLRKKR